MGAKKVGVSKDWWRGNDSAATISRRSIKIECIKSEDLPNLMTKDELAAFFKCHPKTIQKWWDRKALGSQRVRGRRFSTPQDIAYFLESERKKHG